MRSIGSRIRIQSVDEVRASLDTFGGGVAGKMDASRPGPAPLVSAPGFTYRAMFEDVDRRLAAARENLVKAEDAHVRRLIQVSDLKRESDRLTLDLYDEQVSVRRTLAGVYGPEHGFELAAIQGNTPQELKPLSHQVELTIELLREPEITAPAKKVAGVQIDFGEMAFSLESGLDGIAQAGARLERARKASGQSLIAKRQATAEFDGLFPWAAQALEGFFRMAGEPELADRIRTSRRRVTRRQKAEPADEEPSEAPSSGGSVAEVDAPSSPAAAGSASSSDS